MRRLRQESLIHLDMWRYQLPTTKLSIYYNNVHYWKSSIPSAKSDPKFHSSQLVLFNETHLSESDKIEADLQRTLNVCRVDRRGRAHITCTTGVSFSWSVPNISSEGTLETSTSGLCFMWKLPLLCDQFSQYCQNDCKFLVGHITTKVIEGIVGVFYCRSKVSQIAIKDMFIAFMEVARDSPIL